MAYGLWLTSLRASSEFIYVRYPEKVERRPDPDVRYPEKAKRRPDKIAAVRYSGGMLTEKNSGCEIFGWNVGGEEFRM